MEEHKRHLTISYEILYPAYLTKRPIIRAIISLFVDILLFPATLLTSILGFKIRQNGYRSKNM